MNKFLIVAVVLVGVLALTRADSGDEDCALFGGTCSPTCATSNVMGAQDGQNLCRSANVVCCNNYSDKCKAKGGECVDKCQGNIPRATTEDCKSLNRECCIYV